MIFSFCDTGNIREVNLATAVANGRLQDRARKFRSDFKNERVLHP